MALYRHSLVVLFFCLVLPLTTASWADDVMAAPAGRILLTVSGEISVSNVDGTAQFDLEMLRDFSALDISTTTIWTDRVHMFTGVPLALLLEGLGSSGSTLRAQAINDYAVDIPVASITKEAPILAYEIDGAAIPRRKKGPLWVIYPYDDNTDFRSELIYSRSIWQLDRITVLD